MIPGWSQSAALFKYQLEGLSDRYRVIAVDVRGHGESDKPKHGYRMGRLAMYPCNPKSGFTGRLVARDWKSLRKKKAVLILCSSKGRKNLTELWLILLVSSEI